MLGLSYRSVWWVSLLGQCIRSLCLFGVFLPFIRSVFCISSACIVSFFQCVSSICKLKCISSMCYSELIQFYLYDVSAQHLTKLLGK